MNLRQLRKLVNETVRGEQRKERRRRGRTSQRWNTLVESTTARVLLEDADPDKITKIPTKLSDVVSQIGADGAKKQVQAGLDDGADAGDDQISSVDIGDGIDAKELKPSQSTMKVQKACQFAFSAMMKKNPMFDGPGGDMGAIISSDNHLMDGHHRWIATLMTNPNAKCGGAKLDLPANKLIGVLNLVTVGKMGRTKGNPGEGKFADFTAQKMAPLVKDILDNGYWAEGDGDKCKAAAQKHFDLSEDDNEKLAVEIAKKFASNIAESGNNWKTVPKGAPNRIEMPVINKEEVDGVVKDLEAGEVDVAESYANESVDLRRWNKLAGLLKD